MLRKKKRNNNRALYVEVIDNNIEFALKQLKQRVKDSNLMIELKEKIIPKANRAVFFDPSQPHSSSPCTDRKRRVNINFNYF